MNKTKKLSFYQVDPHYFKDYSGDGIGDFRGFAEKIEYFKYLGIDAVILQNILSIDTDEMSQNFTQISKNLGNINELQKVLNLAKKQETKIIIEFGIGQIKEAHKWFKNSIDKKHQGSFDKVVNFFHKKEDETLNYKFNSKTKSYYILDEQTKQIPLNWKSEQVLEKFIDIIRFWHNLGVSGFVFKDFEFLSDIYKKDLMSYDTLKELRRLYTAIKEIDDEIIVIGKSIIIKGFHSKEFTGGHKKIFDYFLNESFSFIGTKDMNTDLIGKFSTKELVKEIKEYVNSRSNILSFGSEKVGRINSRWGDNGQYWQESAKALGILLMFTPTSSAIYYGEEIGTLNIGLTHLDDFNDPTLNERKRHLETKGIKEKDFMNAQVLQNSINAKSLMAWNEYKNGGFSSSEKTITPISLNYKEINVKNQFKDKNSTLIFYKELIRMINKSFIAEILSKGLWKISSSLIPGIIKIFATYKDKEIKILINLTNKNRPIKKVDFEKVILSSYKYKKYYSKDLLTNLDAYEAIVISNFDDDAKTIEQLKFPKSKSNQNKQEFSKQQDKLKNIFEIKNESKMNQIKNQKIEDLAKKKIELETLNKIKLNQEKIKDDIVQIKQKSQINKLTHILENDEEKFLDKVGKKLEFAENKAEEATKIANDALNENQQVDTFTFNPNNKEDNSTNKKIVDEKLTHISEKDEEKFLDKVGKKLEFAENKAEEATKIANDALNENQQVDTFTFDPNNKDTKINVDYKNNNNDKLHKIGKELLEEEEEKESNQGLNSNKHNDFSIINDKISKKESASFSDQEEQEIIKEHNAKELLEIENQEAENKQDAFNQIAKNLKKEFATEETQDIKLTKQESISELKLAKNMRMSEEKTTKNMLANKNKSSIMDEQILDSDLTTLTEEEIAPTTQIEPEEMDDLEIFTKTNKKD